MFGNLFGKKKKMENRRKHVRAGLTLKVCAVFVKSIDKASNARSYSRCVVVETANLSAGGACLKHGNILLSGDMVELRVRSNAKESCLQCKSFPMVTDDLFLVQTILGKVVWRNEHRAGIEFIEIDPTDRDTVHKMVWEQHKKEVSGPEGH